MERKKILVIDPSSDCRLLYSIILSGEFDVTIKENFLNIEDFAKDQNDLSLVIAEFSIIKKDPKFENLAIKDQVKMVSNLFNCEVIVASATSDKMNKQKNFLLKPIKKEDLLHLIRQISL